MSQNYDLAPFPRFHKIIFAAPSDKLSAWKSRNPKRRSELFVDFFDFYALGFRQTEYVVSLRQVGGITKEEKQWRGKKLILEDPFVNKRSLTRGVSSPGILDFVNDCFKIGFLYFGTVQTNQGPVITKILVPDISPERKVKGKKQEDEDDVSDDDNSSTTQISEKYATLIGKKSNSRSTFQFNFSFFPVQNLRNPARRCPT